MSSEEDDEEQSDLSVEDQVEHASSSESEDDEADASSSESEDEGELDEETLDRKLERITANDPTLTSVNFEGCGIGDDGAGRLMEALGGNTAVEHLGLANNGISDALVVALVGLLENSTSLLVLDLNGNIIGVEGARAAARFIHNNSSLAWLNLSNCGIGVAGARVLAGALPSNSTLMELWLRDNNIGDEGASVLSGALSGNFTLTVLNLSDNEISDIGAWALAEALLSNISLSTLYLSRNTISDVGARLFAKALLVNCSVTLVYLEENNISQNLEQIVDELAKINDDASNSQEALGLKIEWLVNLDDGGAQLLGYEEGGAKEKAVSLALDILDSLVKAEQRRGLFWLLLGSSQHGKNVAQSVDIATARALYRYAAHCGAAPVVLMNLLRAHESLCTCRDVKHKLYPFMLLATMSEAGVQDVMEVLKKDPTLVRSGIFQTATANKRKR